ncbi:MAG: hypothetical protein ACYSWZ_00685 [Planctomycetota bacterium]|jgi:hypothetical protein
MMLKVFLLSLVTASISFTVAETKLFELLRRRMPKESFGAELLSCGYCLGHWIAFALVAVYQPRLFECWWLLDYFLTAIVIAWLAGIQWSLMCFLVDKAGK